MGAHNSKSIMAREKTEERSVGKPSCNQLPLQLPLGWPFSQVAWAGVRSSQTWSRQNRNCSGVLGQLCQVSKNLGPLCPSVRVSNRVIQGVMSQLTVKLLEKLFWHVLEGHLFPEVPPQTMLALSESGWVMSTRSCLTSALAPAGILSFEC